MYSHSTTAARLEQPFLEGAGEPFTIPICWALNGLPSSPAQGAMYVPLALTFVHISKRLCSSVGLT
jgi:hypothetical protein